MSTEEKLEKCIEFIRQIERNNINCKIVASADNYSLFCNECGSSDIDGDITITGIPDILREKAWHLLCDVDGL